MANKDKTARLGELKEIFLQAVEDEQVWRNQVMKKCRRYYEGNPAEYRRSANDNEIKKVKDICQNEIAPQIDGVLGENEFLGYQWRVRPFGAEDEAMAVVCEALMQSARVDGEIETAEAAVFEDGVIGGRGVSKCVIKKCHITGQKKVTFEHIPWDDVYIDRGCRKMNLDTARYVFHAKWIPYEVAKSMGAETAWTDELIAEEDTIATTREEDESQWNDPNTKRLRVVEAWTRHDRDEENEGGTVRREVFYEGGLLESEDDPYSNPDRPDGVPSFNKFPFVPFYVKWDVDGDPYGLVSNMIHQQDMIDMHASKARYELLTLRLFAEPDAFDMTPKEVAEQLADPAAYLRLKPGAISQQRYQIDEGLDKAQLHEQMSQIASASLRRVSGINAEYQGVSGAGQSGVALQHREERSRRILSKVFGNARRAQILKGRMFLELAAHWYTEDRIVRITNTQREQLERIGEQMGDTTAVNFNAAMISALKYDVTVDRIAANPNIQHEQFKGLVELRKSGSMIPDEAIIGASDLIKKEDILVAIKEAKQQASQPPMDVQAKAQKDMADAQLKQVQAMVAQQEAQLKAAEVQSKTQLEQMASQLKQIEAQVAAEHTAIDTRRLDALEKKTQAEIGSIRAETDKLRAEAVKILEEARHVGDTSPSSDRRNKSEKPSS